MARDHRFPDCSHARETDNPGIVDCTKGGMPHVGVCANCDHTGEPGAPTRPDGRRDYTGCQGCKDKMLRKMQDDSGD